jgi:hypothetical protein
LLSIFVFFMGWFHTSCSLKVDCHSKL